MRKATKGFLSIASCACLTLCVASAFGANLSRSGLENHLASAERAFKRAMELDSSDPDSARASYEEAILHYERIVKEGGVHSGPLFYDLGNAYFRIGDIGRAILNYKRAALFMANDQNLRQNLEYARNRRADRIEVKQREQVYRTLFFIHYDISSRARLLIFVASFAILWVAASLKLFVRSSILNGAMAIAIVSSAVFAISLVADAISASRTPEGVIIAEEVIARMGDAETYSPAFKEPLHAGTEFRVIGRRAGWWQIELPSGERAWIPSRVAELVNE